MKRLLLLLMLLMFVVPLSHAQSNPQTGHGAPSGVCLGPYVDIDTGNFYVCKVGQYVQAAPTAVNSPGVFTSTQQNDAFSFSTLGGNANCPLGVPSLNGTDTVGVCMNTPSSGANPPNFFNGLASYVTMNYPGFAGRAANGILGRTVCNSVVAECEGGTFAAIDIAGVGGALLVGGESDTAPQNASDTQLGFIAVHQSAITVNGNGSTGAAFQARIQSTGKWVRGFDCQDGTLLNAAQNNPCFNTGKQTTGSSVNSNTINFTANDGSADFNAGIALQQAHYFQHFEPIIQAASNGDFKAYGIYLKSTSALTYGQLVKIDTANADSVVLCTTTDTHCIGVVADKLNASGFCTAGSAFCAIITTAGSFVQLTLGTGTCAIGNFVIADTTTSGRIKCQATIPAAGAYIGDALSAQAAVGSTVDILTKFQ